MSPSIPDRTLFRLPRSPLHEWNLSPREAMDLQNRLATRVMDRAVTSLRQIRYVAGLDVSYEKATDRCHAAIVVVDRKTMETIDEAAVSRPSTFPYVPGLLSFREIPPLLEALKRINAPIDAFIADGQGFAHPRRFGLACHFGLWVHTPTLGCAKSILIGRHDEPGWPRGSQASLIDPGNGDRIGVALRTRDGVAPVYVSIGHRIRLDQAIRLVLSCSSGYRLTEPIRRAHQVSNRIRRLELGAETTGKTASPRR